MTVLRGQFKVLAWKWVLALAVSVSLLGSLPSTGFGATPAACGKSLGVRTQDLVGVLVQTRSGTVFATGDYLEDDHKGLIYLIEREHGPILHDFWRGEIRVIRNPGARSPWQIIAVNETSGSRDEWVGSKSSDPILKFREMMKEYVPELVSPDLKYFRYDPAQEHLNLAVTGRARYIRHDYGVDMTKLVDVFGRAGEEIQDRESAKLFWATNPVSIPVLHRVVETIRFLNDEGYLKGLLKSEQELLDRALKATKTEDFISWRPQACARLATLLLNTTEWRRAIRSPFRMRILAP